VCRKSGTNHDGDLKRGNRSQVRGSTFRVKDKEGIKDPKFSIKIRFGILSPFSEKQIAFI